MYKIVSINHRAISTGTNYNTTRLHTSLPIKTTGNFEDTLQVMISLLFY